LALAIAADRRDHLDKTILPAIARGEVVISDRYVQSSLVLQRLDGLSLKEIWAYNDSVRPPDMTFYLQDDVDEIGRRLGARPTRSRLEQAGSPARELSFYIDAFNWLSALGWRQTWIDCQGKSPEEVAVEVFGHIDGLAG
jgi:dTMP kinase